MEQTKENNSARLKAELARRKKIQDEKDKEAKEKLFTELRKERDLLPSRLEQLEKDMALMERLSKVSDFLLQRILLYDIAQRLSVFDIETTSEMMLEPCLKIASDIVAEADGGRRLKVLNKLDVSYRKAQEIKIRLEQLKKQKDENDEVVPHQYSAIVNNLQAIKPSCTRELLEALITTNAKCIEIMKESIENYKKAKLD